jgi:hypothetical protein
VALNGALSDSSSSRRKLRAIEIRGEDGGGAIHIERVLLQLTGTEPVICLPERLDATSTNSEEDLNHVQATRTAFPQFFTSFPILKSGDASEHEESKLVAGLDGRRISGWIKNINAERDRGYIRADHSIEGQGVTTLAGQDAVLNMDMLVWSTGVDARSRVVEEGVLVEYTVVGFDRQLKPIAAVVTGTCGVPLHPERWEMTEVAKKRKAAEEEAHRSDLAGGGSELYSVKNMDGRKRDREEEQLLLGDDEIYNW